MILSLSSKCGDRLKTPPSTPQTLTTHFLVVSLQQPWNSLVTLRLATLCVSSRPPRTLRAANLERRILSRRISWTVPYTWCKVDRAKQARLMPRLPVVWALMGYRGTWACSSTTWSPGSMCRMYQPLRHGNNEELQHVMPKWWEVVSAKKTGTTRRGHHQALTLGHLTIQSGTIWRARPARRKHQMLLLCGNMWNVPRPTWTLGYMRSLCCSFRLSVEAMTS